MDFDDTLLDNSVVRASVEQACEAIAAAAPEVDREQLLLANTKAWNQYWPEVEPLCWIGEMEMLDVSREVWRRSLEACGCDDSAVVDLAYETHQRIGGEMCRLFDDVPDFLHTLERAGIATALVTNSSMRAQTEKLRVVDLDSAFTAIIISGEVGVAKPNPTIFRIALERLQLRASDVWHIGDSLSTDVAGAQAAGIRSVWLNRGGRSLDSAYPQPDLQVRSLREISVLLLR